MAELPRITVVTPSYNQGPFLDKAIRSVLDQGYPNLEYLVYDGGSTDESVEIIRRYADRIAYWQSQPDGGQTAAINAAWQRATGTVLAWLNSDDYYLPGTLEFVGRYFLERPGLLMLYGQGKIVDSEGRLLSLGGLPFDLRRILLSGNNAVPQPSAFVSRAAFELVGPLDERLNYQMDLDFFIRVSERQAPQFVPRPLAALVIRDEGKLQRDRAVARREAWAVRMRYARGGDRFVVVALSFASRAMHAAPPLRDALDLVRGVRQRW